MNKLGKWLFNPFRYIAGVEALGLGIAICIVSALLADVFEYRFDGLLEIDLDNTTFLNELAKLIIVISVFTAFLWIAGKILSKTHFRLVDLAGTQIVAHWPLQFFALLINVLPGIDDFARSFATARPDELRGNWSGADMGMTLLLTVITLPFVVWTVALLYQSFRISCNVRGYKAGIAFSAGLILAMVVSRYSIYVLF